MKSTLFFVLGLLVLAGLSNCTSTKKPPSQLVASDDVPDDVAQKARRIAEDQPLLKSALSSARLVYVTTEVVREKTEDGEDGPEDLYRVIHYRYDDDAAIHSLVNLRTSATIDQRALPHLPTSLAAEELEAAKVLALKDPKVQRALGKDAARVEVEGLVIRTASEKDPWYGRRVVKLLFRVGRDYRHSPSVIVDLTKQSVHVETEGEPK